jgi:hypothetical protein
MKAVVFHGIGDTHRDDAPEPKLDGPTRPPQSRPEIDAAIDDSDAVVGPILDLPLS